MTFRIWRRGPFTPDSDDGLMLLDDDLRIHGVSSGYERLAMRQRAELAGNLLFDCSPTVPAIHRRAALRSSEHL